ncbi:MAG: LPS assembly lipoprotein LptE [Thiohalomonadales bacterium]
MKNINNVNKNFKIVIIFLLLNSCVLLVSCGFHLRGAIEVPDVLKNIYVAGDVGSNEIGTVLFRRMKQLGIERIDIQEDSTAILSITKNNFVRRVLTVDSGNKASAYKLDLVIGFQVYDNKGKVLLKNQELRQTREYNIDPLNRLASGDQEIRLKLEMSEFIVNQMLTRLSFAFKESN